MTYTVSVQQTTTSTHQTHLVTLDISPGEFLQQVLQKPSPLVGCWDVGEKGPEGIWEEHAGEVVQVDQHIQHVWPTLQVVVQALPLQGLGVVDELGYGQRTVFQNSSADQIANALQP